jgi:NDP-sugar pyrophosphorylase family protein
MQAVILAGGKGTRLRPLTIHTPKPIMPLVGRPFLFYQLDLLRRADVHDVVLSLSYQPNKIKDIFGDGSHFDMHIEYTVEPQPLGTAGAYKNAEGVIDSSTVVFNGDVLTDLDLNEVIRFHRERKALVTIVLTPVENPRAYGLVEIEADGRVLRFREKPTRDDEITTNTINAGTYIIEPEVLQEIPSGESYSFEYDLFPKLLAKGAAVYGFVSKYYWIDIGTPQRYVQANLDLLRAGLPDSRFGQPERHEKVDARAEIDPLSWLDPTVTVKAGARVVNSVIEANCVVEEKAVIERSVVRRATRIGHSAVVRDSAIGLGVHVGRNASVSRAVLGDKSALTDYSTVGEAQ